MNEYVQVYESLARAKNEFNLYISLLDPKYLRINKTNLSAECINSKGGHEFTVRFTSVFNTDFFRGKSFSGITYTGKVTNEVEEVFKQVLISSLIDKKGMLMVKDGPTFGRYYPAISIPKKEEPKSNENFWDTF